MNVLIGALLFLVTGALLMSFASYRSQSIGGSEVVNAGRILKTVAYTLVILFTIDMLVTGAEAPAWLLPIAIIAFSELIQGMSRIKDFVPIGPWLEAHRHRTH